MGCPVFISAFRDPVENMILSLIMREFFHGTFQLQGAQFLSKPQRVASQSLLCYFLQEKQHVSKPDMSQKAEFYYDIHLLVHYR